MKLRIVAGTLKGRMITIPGRDTTFRPTREQVRESVAAILSPRITDAAVADVCAGSGAFGFEMISRGAKRVTFVDSHHARCKCLRTHAETFGIADRCSIREDDIGSFLATPHQQFDILYFDPPYDDGDLHSYLTRLLAMITVTGVLVYERRHSKKDGHQELSFPLYQIDKRIYGETEICIFKKMLLSS